MLFVENYCFISKTPSLHHNLTPEAPEIEVEMFL